MDFFNSILNGATNFLGGGTDRFTRTPVMDLDWLRRITSKTYQEQWVTVSGKELDLVRTTAELSIVIGRKASMFSNGRFLIKDYKTGEEIENHPFLKVLENPNAIQDRNLLLQTYSQSMDVYGNYFMYANKGSRLSEFPSTLVSLPTEKVVINRKGQTYKAIELTDLIKNYIVKHDGFEDETFEVDEIIHFKNVNLRDDVLGESPLHALQMQISNIRGAMGFRNINITENGGLGVISPKDSTMGAIALTPEDKIEIDKQFSQDYGIFSGQARRKYSPKAIDYTPLAYPLKENMLFEEVDDNFKRIIDLLGMNENLFSRSKQSTFTNVLESEKIVYQDTIIPMSENFCFKLNTDLGLFEQGVYVEIDYSHIPSLSTDEKARAETNKLKVDAYISLVTQGFNEKEAREIIGL